MATLNATNLKHASSGSNNIVLAADGSVNIPTLTANSFTTSSSFGKVLQCKYAIKNDSSSATGTSHTEISSDFRLTLTPTSASNLIEIEFNVQHGMTTAEVATFRIYKSSSTDMSSPDWVQEPTSNNHYGDGNATIYTVARWSMYTTIKVLELAGNTNARTYSPFWARTGGTSYLNAYNSSNDYQGTSNMTVKEIAV